MSKYEHSLSQSLSLESITTLHFLQTKKIVPETLTPVQMKNQTFQYQSFLSKVSCFLGNDKVLLKNSNNVIYYGPLNKDGIPHFQNEEHKKMMNKTKLIKNLDMQFFQNDALMIFADGSYYLGEIQRGQPSGFGLLTNRDSIFQYKGFFKRGMPEGFGFQRISTVEYQGDFHRGKKHGNGKMYYSSDIWFEGEFKQNQIQGMGKYHYKNIIWDGKWQNGCLEGKGRQLITKENEKNLIMSSQYFGEFKKGEREGHGKYRWGKGYQYEGLFQKGQLNGSGNFQFKNKIYKGKWKDGLEMILTEEGNNTSRFSLISTDGHRKSKRISANLL